MMKCIFLSTVLLMCDASLWAQKDGDPITIGHYCKLDSAILNEERILQISLPRNYDPHAEKRYPVLYCLDGEYCFASSVTTVEQTVYFEEAEGVPAMIVVGIPNPSRECRDRDMFPGQTAGTGSSRFLQFIQQEVIAFVDSHYLTNGTQLLMGQSSSGFFAWWTQLQEPTLFQGIIATSPSFATCRPYMINEIQTHAENDNLNKAYLYLARGTLGREEGVAESMAMFLPLLAPAEGLTIRVKVYEELGHVPYPALYNALKTMGTDRLWH